MPRHHILFLGSTQLTAYRVGGGAIHDDGTFAADAAGLEAFGGYLKQHHGRRFLLLADSAQEGFQSETIPHSRGRDRQAIIERKLSQHFHATPLRLACPQGRLKHGRRDERLLLMALTRPQSFEPWCAVLRETGSLLAGIYSLAQIAHHVLPADTPSPVLLITQTRSGLRQTFYAERQLRFSRLTPLPDGSAPASSDVAALEVGKMYQYLASQQLIDGSQPLAIRVLASPAQQEALRTHCPDSDQLRFAFIDLPQTGLTAAETEKFFCQLLDRKPPTGQFASRAECRPYHLWQTRRVLNVASAAIFAGGLVVAAWQGLAIVQTQERIAQHQQQAHRDQQHYAAALQALPKIPLSTDNVRALVERYDQVVRRAPGPAPLLEQLSQSLDAFPAIVIEHLEWSLREALETPAGGRPPGMTDGPYAQLAMAAQLPLDMAGNLRGQRVLLADFIAHLGAAPATWVTQVNSSVDTPSGKTLRSGAEKNSPEAPQFSVHLMRKL
jgi:hypothetical protein